MTAGNHRTLLLISVLGFVYSLPGRLAPEAAATVIVPPGAYRQANSSAPGVSAEALRPGGARPARPAGCAGRTPPSGCGRWLDPAVQDPAAAADLLE